MHRDLSSWIWSSKMMPRALHKPKLPRSPFNECYYHEMWLEDLPHSLLWVPGLNDCQELNHTPSFSWGCRSGPVPYFPAHISPTPLTSDGIYSQEGGDCFVSLQRVESGHVSYIDLTIDGKFTEHKGMTVSHQSLWAKEL
jgi:hypothetical protein